MMASNHLNYGALVVMLRVLYLLKIIIMVKHHHKTKHLKMVDITKHLKAVTNKTNQAITLTTIKTKADSTLTTNNSNAHTNLCALTKRDIFMFIVSVIFLIFIVVVVFASALIAFSDAQAFGGGIAVMCVALVFIITPVTIHNSDKIDYANTAKILNIHKKHIEQLENQLSSVDVKAGAILNHDSPYATIYTQLASVRSEFKETELKLFNCGLDIEKRRVGFFQYATWMD